jgi:CBS domain-containing protein
MTVYPDETVQCAIDKMIEHDYSQLPVVDKDGKPLGMVTTDSILRALERFQTPIDALKVSHAKVKAPRYRPEDDLFDLLNGLRDTYAVLIVDADGVLRGIVTSYDTAEYFRSRAEDLMLIEDIENDLKEHIRMAFSDANGVVDEDGLTAAIVELEQAKGGEFSKRFRKGLGQYLKLQTGRDPKLQTELVEQVLTGLSPDERTIPGLDDLTLGDYVTLLLRKEKRGHFESIFGLESKAVENVLTAVRDTRNALAHFREVTAKQRHQLRFAAEWLKDHRPRQILASQPIAEQGGTFGAGATHVLATGTATRAMASLAPVEEELSPNDSRYARLALHLRARDADDDVLTFTFEQIAAIIGDRLPQAAYQHRSWWANDSHTHVQSKQWLEVGWRVASVDTEAQTVIFARSEKRAQAYRSFFTSLLSNLAQRAQTSFRSASPDGRSWVQVDDLSDSLGAGTVLFCSFARSGRFRVELYIDAGDVKENKRRFDALYERRPQIEDALQTAVAWERMNEQRACRVALYRKGAITDESEALASLCVWAGATIIPFREVLTTTASGLG